MQINKILDYVYPPRCPVCDAISAQGICDSCREKIVYITESFCLKCGKPLENEDEEFCPDCSRKKHAFDEGRGMFSYQGDIRRSLYRLKYSNKREYAEVYGREMTRFLGRWIQRRKITRIVPVPLHPSRYRERGYNQAALIAREIGRQTGIPVDERLLYRKKKTTPQKKLTAAERKANLREAFEIRGKLKFGEHILLVDDIYTTGNTVDAAALCLKQQGPCHVYVVTVAIGG